MISHSFVKIIDAVGGVDITMSDAEANLVVHSSGGTYHLNGEQALTYSRIRYIDSDFYRTGRQRNVINAVFSKMKNMSLTEVLDLLDIVLPSLTTDMSNMDIIATVTKIFPIIQSSDIQSYRVPADNAFYYATISGMSVIVPDIPLCCQQLREQFLPMDKNICMNSKLSRKGLVIKS